MAEYKICANCIMDTSDPEITFDQNNVCNHCLNYRKRAAKELKDRKELQELVCKIKKKGWGKKHDCLIGLSGGVDSSTVAFLLFELGLRPLAINLDNGWNAGQSERNIAKIVRHLNLDLITYKLDWIEFSDLQKAFLKASVVNAEIPTDHAIMALLFKTAVKNKIKYVISGGNIVTEAVMPDSWGYDSKDLKYLKSVYKRFGTGELESFPVLSNFDWIYNAFFRKIKCIPILNYTDYSRESAKHRLKQEIGWEDYGLKHGESIYTRFFQNYILPKKFGIDKRRAHFSNLICSGQMTREKALEEIKKTPYENWELEQKEKNYVINKLGFEDQEFERIMSLPKRPDKEIPNNCFWYKRLNFLIKLTRKKITNN